MTESEYRVQVRNARWRGVRDALGVPAAVIAAGMVGFGALAYEAGFSVLMAAACTAGIWALPGQVVLIEMHLAGAAGPLTVLAVMLTSARFLPMAISLMPAVREPGSTRTGILVASQVLSMTSWAWTMRRCAEMPREARLAYFNGFAAACWAAGVLATVVGYYLAGAFPPLLRLGFVFLNPLYFVVLLLGDVRPGLPALALVCGALAGPLLHLVNPQWSVLLAGIAGGTVAYLIQRAVERVRG